MLLVYAYISRQNVIIVIYLCVSGYERIDVQFPFFLFDFPKDSERLQESVSLTKMEGEWGSDGGSKTPQGIPCRVWFQHNRSF